MQTETKIKLLEKFFSGSILDSELKSLFVWLNSEQGNQEYEKLADAIWTSGQFDAVEKVDSAKLYSKISARLQEKQLSGRKPLMISLRKAVAIFILGLVLPLTYFTLLNPQDSNQQVVYLKESLSNEKVRKMSLPDGTAVWLLSGSEITYPSDFTKSKYRKVKVKGEAFFDVAKDSLRPFILDLGEIGLKVVGTSFNVMNFEDEDHVSVVLKSGQVELFKGDFRQNKQLVRIKPGELADYQKKESKFHIQKVEVVKYTSWIDGTLVFRNDPLAEVLKKLGRWYNVEIEINDPSVVDFPFTATIKNENLDQIIDLLEFSTPFKYSKLKTDDGTKLMIMKNS